jgi:hypothetical protein
MEAGQGACMTDTPASRPGFIARHWRGELPLAQAFWQNGLGLALTVALIELFVIGPVLATAGPQVFPLVLVGLTLVNAVFLVWVSVGIWRSANRHWISPATAIAAKVVVVIGCLWFVLHAAMLTMVMTGFMVPR